MKKKTRRDKAEYPALDPTLNLKTRAEHLDFDYINKLSDKEKAYLNNFVNEHVLASFKNPKRIHKKKKIESEKNKLLKEVRQNILDIINSATDIVSKSNIGHQSKIKIKKLLSSFKKDLRTLVNKEFKFIEDYYKQDAEHRNNARNRCVLSRARAQGKVLGWDDIPENYSTNNNVEDELIGMIDNKEEDEED